MYLLLLFCRCWSKDYKCQGGDQVQRVCIHTHTAWHFNLGLCWTTSNYYTCVIVLDTKDWLSAAPLTCLNASSHTTSATTSVDFLAWNHWRRWKVCRHPQGWRAPGARCSTASWAPAARRRSAKDKAPKRPERLIPVRRWRGKARRQRTISQVPIPSLCKKVTSLKSGRERSVFWVGDWLDDFHPRRARS